MAGWCGRDEAGESGLCGRAFVAVVQPVELWNGHDAPGVRRHHRSWSRRVFIEAQMCSRAHVIGDVVRYDPLQSRGIRDDHVVEALAPNRSDEPLDVGVLPGDRGAVTTSSIHMAAMVLATAANTASLSCNR